MDNLYCKGNEHELHHCPFDGWRVHDCEANEVAGVVCKERNSLHPPLPPLLQPSPSSSSSPPTRRRSTTSTTSIMIREPGVEDDSHANQVINSAAILRQPDLPALSPPLPSHPPPLRPRTHRPTYGPSPARTVSRSASLRRLPLLPESPESGSWSWTTPASFSSASRASHRPNVRPNNNYSSSISASERRRGVWHPEQQVHAEVHESPGDRVRIRQEMEQQAE